MPLTWHHCADDVPLEADTGDRAVFHVRNLPGRGAFERFVDARSSIGTAGTAEGGSSAAGSTTADALAMVRTSLGGLALGTITVISLAWINKLYPPPYTLNPRSCASPTCDRATAPNNRHHPSAAAKPRSLA